MSRITCPTCGQSTTSTAEASQGRPDATVIGWYTEAGGGLAGDLHVSDVYLKYLRACDGDPVSRNQFVADLSFLGIDGDEDGNLAFS